MKSSHPFFMAFLLLLPLTFRAQELKDLNQLPQEGIPQIKLFYSIGQEARAAETGSTTRKAYAYLQELLDFTPEVNVLVLSKEDWSKYTTFPVYGMPHYNGKKTLIVAAEDNSFWSSFLPPSDQLPPTLLPEIKKAYTTPNGELSLRPFFDLLVIHELGHVFHFQAKLNIQRKWLQELFVNILLHSYVADNEPERLPPLVMFPRMVLSGGTQDLTYTTLMDIEARYDEIGQKFPVNYGWYQSRWHAAAASIYDTAGKEAGQKLWNALKNQPEDLEEKDLAKFLKGKAHPSIASVLVDWDKNTQHEPSR